MSGGGELRLPPGFRFHPTDDELVKHYLCRKCTAEPIRVPFIAEIDLYRYDPWQLPGMALYGEKEWYFFSPRDRKYPNGSHPNRAAGSGYWKATGADKQIGFPNPIAIKKALVFYVGKAPKGEKTNWIMHEYRLADVDRSARRKNSLRLDDWVLCRIYNKKGASEKQISPYRKPTPETSRQDSSVLQFPNQQLQVVPTTPVTTHLHMSEYPNMYFENSDSIPKLHTDSSCSDQVPSSWERESQSQPAAWIADWERHVEVQIDTVSQPSFPPMPRDDSLMSPAFGDPVLHDIMTYLQKPF